MSIVSTGGRARDFGLADRSGTGDEVSFKPSASRDRWLRWEDGGGVLAGEDF